MKTTRYSFLMLLMALIGMSAEAQQRNVLQVPDVTTQIGNVQLPVSIENTDEVVGAQFDLTLPEGVTAEETGVLANRSDGHTVTVSRLNSGAYRVLLHSAQNRPLRGQSGVVMYLPVNIPDSFEEGSEHPLAVANAVLGKATGENVLTEAIAGSIRISKLPDLTVKNITCDKQTVNPGDRITCAWQVENIGELATGGGWSEQVSLVTEDGSQSKLIATTYNDGTLGASGIVSRQVEITLPTLLGLDGQARLQVRIVPDNGTGESTSAQGNNTQTGSSLLNLNKVLTLELSPNRVDENAGRRIALRVNRSGGWTAAETFAITATADSRVSVPASIIIPANQSGAVVYFNITDNDVLDNDSIVNISVEGNGYAAVSSQLLIDDNEQPDLTLSASKNDITEGDTFQLTITRSVALAQPVTITLTSESVKRFSFPATATIPAGETSVTVNVTAIDDEVPSLELSNVFTVSAPRYNKGEVIVLLMDNDMPALTLELTPNQVQESVGVIAVAGVLRRTTNTNSKITVRLSDDSNGGLYFGNTQLILDKGVEEVHFNFGPVDNALMDGDRTHTITAAVWLSSCNCGAAGEAAGSVTAQLRVVDEDGPALQLTTSAATVKEGDKTTLTVSRNTTDNSAPLTVNIISDYEKGLTYDHTVTIPAGQQSATVEVTSAANSVQGDSHTVVFTVQADGYASGTCYLMVTDQTLPDAVITSISVAEQEVTAGGMATVSITVRNQGSASLPVRTRVKLFMEGMEPEIASLYTSTELESSGTEVLTRTVRLPAVAGSHQLYAVVNDEYHVKELVYTNNMSNSVSLFIAAPYTATVICDKERYCPGDSVIITGSIEPVGSANREVELYVINEGMRQSFTIIADDEGKFSYVYTPYARQMGHFTVGACFPSEDSSREQAAFEYLGLRRTTQEYITCNIMVDTPYSGVIELENPASVDLHNVKLQPIVGIDDCELTADPITTLAGNTRGELHYTLVSRAATEGQTWSSVTVKVVSDEGADLTVPVYFYCRTPQAQLAVDSTAIHTTIVKGTTREYPLTITNKGLGDTGKITLALPSFIQSQNGITLPSLPSGQSVTVILLLACQEEMELNVPINGQMGINCENGNGIAIPFTLLPVSEATGTLIVDVCDDYTYKTPEKPYLEGASVRITQPYDNEAVAQGVTGPDGTLALELPEGYYQLTVTADKHQTYSRLLMVDPSTEKTVTVNIGYEGVTVEWNVEETEVEDVYDITTTVTYETNVPAPVVVVNMPDYIPIDSMMPGESILVYATLTNKGLIAAEGTQLILPSVEYVTFEPLVEMPCTLMPQQTMVVPIRVTLLESVVAEEDIIAPASRRVPSNYGPRDWKIVCRDVVKVLWFHWCGNDHVMHHYELYTRLKKKCGIVTIGEGGSDSEVGVPNGSGGFIWIPSGSSTGQPRQQNKGCKTCLEVLKEKLTKKMLGKAIDAIVPGSECYTATFLCSKDISDKAKDRSLRPIDVADCELEAASCALQVYCSAASGGVGTGACIVLTKLKAIVSFLKDLFDFEECAYFSWEDAKGVRRRTPADGLPSYVKEMSAYNDKLTSEFEAIYDYNLALYGDEAWLDADPTELVLFWEEMAKADDRPLQLSDLENIAPTNLSTPQLTTFINRFNNTFYEQANETGGKIDFDMMQQYARLYLDQEQKAQEAGYQTVADMWLTEFEKYKSRLNEAANSVCATVKLQLSQQMVMTRQAFRGTLTVTNGHESEPMRDVRLNLTIKDSEGREAKAEFFQIDMEQLKGFEGESTLDVAWTLDAGKSGTATILFTPTRYAASREPVKYSFGGTLSYINPFTGLEVNQTLYPVTLTVNPTPILDLAYFMQRDIYGDDPLTEEVEPIVPAEFALVINNKGNGDANNVRMVTQQPEIIENEKGLLINFDLVSSQVNGGDAVLSFSQSIANDFGTIPAHSQMYAQWWLQSSLLGHFTDYDVQATHVTSYGNEDLSLLDEVTIHELIHGFTVRSDGEMSVRGFLVNDIVDADDLPDSVYFTDATQQGAYIATSANIVKLSDTEYVLNVTAGSPGWNYGNLLDPTYGKQKLVKVTRADGAEVNVDNIWQTDRTLRDGKDWLYENRLHFVGNMSVNGETFYLTFEPKPEQELEVESYSGVPAEGTVLKEQLTELTVKFNKPIKAESFTTEDITINCQGVAQDASQIVIEQVNESEYKLTLNEVTLLDGYYVLTIQTAGIEDKEGFTGSAGKQATWIQFVDGKVALKVTASPTEGGTVTPASGRFDYDSNVTLKATAAEGYDFTGWTIGGEVLSSESEFNYHLIADTELKAQFTIKHFNVCIDYDATRGTVNGAATGIYDYGTQLQVTAIPANGYVFNAWVVNDELSSESSSYTITVDRDIDIEALFDEDIITELKPVENDDLQVRLAPISLREYMYITGNFNEIRQVDIYDMRGIKSVTAKNVQQGLYVGHLSTGIYYVLVSTDKGVYRAKVLKR